MIYKKRASHFWRHAFNTKVLRRLGPICIAVWKQNNRISCKDPAAPELPSDVYDPRTDKDHKDRTAFTIWSQTPEFFLPWKDYWPQFDPTHWSYNEESQAGLAIPVNNSNFRKHCFNKWLPGDIGKVSSDWRGWPDGMSWSRHFALVVVWAGSEEIFAITHYRWCWWPGIFIPSQCAISDSWEIDCFKKLCLVSEVEQGDGLDASQSNSEASFQISLEWSDVFLFGCGCFHSLSALPWGLCFQKASYWINGWTRTSMSQGCFRVGAVINGSNLLNRGGWENQMVKLPWLVGQSEHAILQCLFFLMSSLLMLNIKGSGSHSVISCERWVRNCFEQLQPLQPWARVSALRKLCGSQQGKGAAACVTRTFSNIWSNHGWIGNQAPNEVLNEEI